VTPKALCASYQFGCCAQYIARSTTIGQAADHPRDDGDRVAIRGSRRLLLHGGQREYEVDGIRVLPLATALPALPGLLAEAGARGK
jgi:hypothetical protein